MPFRISRRVGNWLLMARVYHPVADCAVMDLQLCVRCANAECWTPGRDLTNAQFSTLNSYSRRPLITLRLPRISIGNSELSIGQILSCSEVGSISLEVSAIAATISRHAEDHEISYSRPRTVVLARDHHLSRPCVHFCGGAAHTGSAEHKSATLGLGDWRFHNIVRNI